MTSALHVSAALNPAVVDDEEEDVTEDVVYGKLVVIEKDNFDGPSFKFTGSAVFGRSKRCDVRINLSFVSRRHAHLYVDKKGRVMLHNLTDRENATMVNEKPLEPGASVRLKDKDNITIVDRSFRWEICPEFGMLSSSCVSSLKSSKLIPRKQQLMQEEKNLRRRRSERIVISSVEKENVSTQAEKRQMQNRRTSLTTKQGNDIGRVITPKPLLRKALATPIRIQIAQRRKIERADDSAKQLDVADEMLGRQKKRQALPTPLRKDIAQISAKDADVGSVKQRRAALPTLIRQDIAKGRSSMVKKECNETGLVSEVENPRRALPTPLRKQITRNDRATKNRSTPAAKAAPEKKLKKSSKKGGALSGKRKSTSRKSLSKKRALPTPVRKDIAKRRKSKAKRVLPKLQTPLCEAIKSFEKQGLQPLYKKLTDDLQGEIKNGIELERVMKKALNTPIRSDIQMQLTKLRKMPCLPRELQMEIAQSRRVDKLEIPPNSVVVSLYPRSAIEETIEGYGVDAQSYLDWPFRALRQRQEAMAVEIEATNSIFDAFEGTRKTFSSPVVESNVHWTYSDYEDAEERTSTNVRAESLPKSRSVRKRKSTAPVEVQEQPKRRKSVRLMKAALADAAPGTAEVAPPALETANPNATADGTADSDLANTSEVKLSKPRRKSLRLAARANLDEANKVADGEDTMEEAHKVTERCSEFAPNIANAVAEPADESSIDSTNNTSGVADLGHSQLENSPTASHSGKANEDKDERMSLTEPTSDDELDKEKPSNQDRENAVTEKSDEENQNAENVEDGEKDITYDQLGETQKSTAVGAGISDEEAEVENPKRTTRSSRRKTVAAPARKTRSQSSAAETGGKAVNVSKKSKQTRRQIGKGDTNSATPATFEAGDRVRVFWEEDQKWYEGVIKSFYRKTKARVVYDDGETVLEPVSDLQHVSNPVEAPEEKKEEVKRTRRTRAKKVTSRPIRKSTRTRK